MSIPPRFLEELRSRLTLSDIIGRSVRLTRAGREFKGCCPFHNEKTPSFTVNDDKQFYHCFGCGAHGDVVGFVMQSRNFSFIEAVEMLAGEANLPVPKPSPQAVAKAKKEKSLYSLLEDATRWMEDQLRIPENRDAYRYISERGNSEELLRNYRVGYAPHDGQAIRKAMLALDYTDKQMIEAGVLRSGKNGREPYAFFRERIIFPVPDRRGRVIAYGGRILPDHMLMPNRGDYTPAKYMNSSDTTLFHKGSMLYGEPHARQAAIDGQSLIVVEGYIDVMASFKAGYRGALAPLGTALTEEQIMALWKMIPDGDRSPILCFDGDNAGRRAAARACERLLPLLKPYHSARFAFLPDGQDPDSLVNSGGKKAFSAVLESAMPLVDFLWLHHTQGKNFDTPELRAGLTKTLEDEALRIADRDVQHYYRQAFRDKIRKAFSDYQGGYQKSQPYKKGGFRRPQDQQGNFNSQIRRPSFSKRIVTERALVTALINHPELCDRYEEEIGALNIKENRLDQLRQNVLSLHHSGDEVTSETMKQQLADQGFSAELRGLLSESVYTHAGFARPQTEIEAVCEGWQRALGFLNSVTEEQEKRLQARKTANHE